MLKLVVEIGPAPARPIELSFGVTSPHKVLYCHPESIVSPVVTDYAVACTMNKNYRSTFDDLILIFLASEGTTEYRSFIKSIRFIPSGVIKPRNKVIC